MGGWVAWHLFKFKTKPGVTAGGRGRGRGDAERSAARGVACGCCVATPHVRSTPKNKIKTSRVVEPLTGFSRWSPRQKTL